MEEIRLDIPFRKDNPDENEVRYSDFGAIVSGPLDDENYQRNFLSIERPLKATEVFSKLRKKGWGKFDSRFMTESDIISTQRLMYRVYIPYKYGENQETEVDYPEDPIDVIDTGYRNVGEEEDVRISPFFQMWPEKFSSNPNHNDSERRAIKTEVDSLYNDIFGEDLSSDNVIALRRSTRGVLSILEKSVSFDLVASDSDFYTNSLDLSELRRYAVVSGISARIDVTVQYSIYDENAEEGKKIKVFNRDSSFSAFRYEYDKESNVVECISDSFKETINNDIIVSYISDIKEGSDIKKNVNLLEVIPISDRVSECIISRCVVTYGKF